MDKFWQWEIIERMRKFKEQRKLSDTDWLWGCNYDHNFLEEGCHPNCKVLDQISDRNPLETESEKLAEIQVCMIVKDNEIVYKK